MCDGRNAVSHDQTKPPGYVQSDGRMRYDGIVRSSARPNFRSRPQGRVLTRQDNVPATSFNRTLVPTRRLRKSVCSDRVGTTRETQVTYGPQVPRRGIKTFLCQLRRRRNSRPFQERCHEGFRIVVLFLLLLSSTSVIPLFIVTMLPV